MFLYGLASGVWLYRAWPAALMLAVAGWLLNWQDMAAVKRRENE